MADNVGYTEGAGKTIRTKDRATAHTPVSLLDIGGASAEALVGDAGVYMPVEGAAAENAAAAGNPVLSGGRYDLTPRTLGDGDAGAIALDPDGAVHVSDGGNTLTVDGTVTETNSAAILADTASMDTNLTTVAGAVSGTEMQVDVVAPLPAGTNAIGTLAANSGVDIGDVDVTSVVPGTGATNLGKAEDAAHTTGDTGVMSLAVRNDNLAALAGTDGDYAPLQVNADGSLYTTLGGAQSSGNTSTTPLTGAATFTGTGEQNEYPDVMVSCFADQAGTLYFDFSVDGSNWRTFPTSGFAVSASVHEFHTAVKGPRYFRVRYVNGGSAQSTFQLYTYYGNFAKLPNAPLNQSITSDSDAVITNSVIAADNGSNFVNIGATTAGNLKVSLQEASDGLDIGAGNAGTETLRVSVSTDDVNLAAINTAATATQAAVEIIDNAIYVDDADWSDGVSSHMLVGGLYQSVEQAITDGDVGPFSVDANGRLKVSIEVDNVGIGGGTQYTEDDAAAANPVGSMPVFVRQDTPATLTTTDGDVVAGRATNYGAQFVQVVDSSGNFINTFGGSGGTSHADDAAFTIGGASSITPTGYLADETTPDSVDEGDVGVPRMTLTRKPYAVITDATSENNAAVDGSGHLQVDIAADSVGIGGGTQYAVDDALGATPTGTAALAKVDAALSALTPVDGDAENLRVDANGALWVIPSGTVSIQEASALDVSGATVTTTPAVTGGGTEATAQRVTIASDSTGVISVDDNGGALTVDNGGTFAVQEDGAALTALQLIDDPVATDDTTTHTAATTKVMGIGAVATPTDTTVDANDIAMPAMSTDRRLHVDAQVVGQDAVIQVTDDGTAILVDGSAVTQPVSGTVTVTHPALGGGTEAGAQRVTIASDSTGVLSVDDGGGNLSVDWAGTVPPIGAGTEAAALRVTLATDSTGVVSVDDNGGAITVDNGGTFAVQSTLQTGSALVGDVGISGARTSGGTTMYKNLDVDETEDAVKASAGQVYWIHAMNLSASKLFLKFYNATVATVVVGTTTPDLTFCVPTLGDTNGAGFNLAIPNGIAFGTAITVAATTGFADNDTGAPGANELILNLGYA